jgi:DNA-directed RNA polymerase specialized sigma subunit
MAEITAYFESVTSKRSMLLTEEEALEGATPISLETQGDMSEENVLSYIEQNLPGFIRILRNLAPEDQELLLSYYMLSKTQNTLAVIHRTTQTLCSFLIRKAVERIGTYILLGNPTQEVMSEIFKRAKLENILENSELSKVVMFYQKTRSFQRVAEVFNLHRPDVRRALRQAAQTLEKSKDNQEKALGAYLKGLIEKASAAG